ncbi:uncharacterized protein LOC111252233 [Varroa destructor]|uniref:Uncharacterized protein n=1 Tax=Varroa destructor TaxID=109461 RepID=A0A7M7KFQ6_VARDE|nr:uncharacterized protein LOC111252233 [Varroa destructor]
MQLLVSSTSNIVKIPKKIHKISVDQANLRKWPNIPYYDLNVAVVRIMTLSEDYAYCTWSIPCESDFTVRAQVKICTSGLVPPALKNWANGVQASSLHVRHDLRISRAHKA